MPAKAITAQNGTIIPLHQIQRVFTDADGNLRAQLMAGAEIIMDREYAAAAHIVCAELLVSFALSTVIPPETSDDDESDSDSE